MHHSRLCHERLPRVLDTFNQIHLPAACHCVWTVCWERRSKRPLRCMYGQCHIKIFRHVQAQRSQDSRNSECLRGSRGRGGLWKSHRRRFVFFRGKRDAHGQLRKEGFDTSQEMSSYFPLKTMWRSYFCALVATAVLAVSFECNVLYLS